MSRLTRSLLLAPMVACLALPAAAEVVPRAAEKSVIDDAARAGRQKSPNAVVIPSGFMLAWEDERRGIVVRWFNHQGDPAGAAVVLAESDPIPPVPFSHVVLREQVNPAIATRGDDTFLLAYTEHRWERTSDIFYDEKLPLSSRVLSRLYAADGRSIARPVELAGADTLAVRPAVIAANPGFWAAWQQRAGETGIFLQRLNPRGQPIGAKQRIATSGERVALAAAAGRVLVSWQQGDDVMARLFDDADDSMSDPFVVAAGQPRAAAAASVAAQPDGSFLVAFQRSLASHALHARVYGQRVSRAGALVGGATLLNADTGDAYSSPRIVALPGGRWMAAWLTWVGNFRVAVEYGVYDRELAAKERGVLNERAIAAQFEIGLSAQNGRIAASWEGYNERSRRSLRTRTFLDTPGN